VSDKVLVARVDKPLGQPINDTQPFDDLSGNHRARLAGKPLRTTFDLQITVEIRLKKW
jgi:hypothetical protein